MIFAFGFGFGLGLCRQHHDRYACTVGAFTRPANKAEAVHHRHVQIGDHQINGLRI